MKTYPAYSSEERNWAMFTHLAALAFFLPFGRILGPLIIWLIKRDEFPFVEGQGKESLNFQLSIFIYQLCCIPLIFFFFLGIPLLIFLAIFRLIMVIIAAIKTGADEQFRYPLSMKLIR